MGKKHMSLFFFKKAKENKKPIVFTTQKDILKNVGLSDETTDISSPLSNLYTKYQLDMINDKQFMQGNALKIYRTATTEECEQSDLELTNEDYQINAFVEAKRAYTNHTAPTFFMNFKMPSDYLLSKSNHIIANIPTKKTDVLGFQLSHQIAFGKVTKHPTQYYYFDVDEPGGEFLGSKDEVLEKVSTATKNSKLYTPYSLTTFSYTNDFVKPTAGITSESNGLRPGC